MDIRYVIAAKRLLSIIRVSDRRLIMDKWLDSILKPHTSLHLSDPIQHYTVCLDHQESVHIVYLSENEELLHVIYDPDTQQLHTRTIPMLYTDKIISLRLFHMNHSLQLFALTPERLLHAKLSGIYWSAVDELKAIPNAENVEIYYENMEWKLVAICKSYDILLFRWLYDPHSLQWKEEEHQVLRTGWDGRTPIFIQLVQESSQNRCWITMSFPRGALMVKRFSCTSLGMSISPDMEAQLLTPIRSVSEAAVLSRKGVLTFIWLAEQQLFQHSYDTHAGAWGLIEATAVGTPIVWRFLTRAFPPPPQPAKWISPDQQMDIKDSPLSAWIQWLNMKQNLDASVTYAESSLHHMTNLLESRDQLKQDIMSIETKLQYWRSLVRQKQARVEALHAEKKQQIAMAVTKGIKTPIKSANPDEPGGENKSRILSVVLEEQKEPAASAPGPSVLLKIHSRLLSLIKRVQKIKS